MNTVHELVEKSMGRPMDESLVLIALPWAMYKLQQIISREGDADGERLKPEYLAKLVAETLQSDMFSDETIALYKEKRRLGAGTPSAAKQKIT